MSLVLDEHRQYLADAARLAAFSQAIAQIVQPGDVVVDLASGTGILGLLACRAGARHVFAIEQDGIAGLARELAVANGYGDRVTVIREHSSRVTLPERGDVMVTDQIGGFGFEAGLLDLTRDAASRLLTPVARMIPGELRIHLAPTECADVRERLRFWRTQPAGFAWGPAAGVAENTGYPIAVAAGDLLAEPQLLYRVELPAPSALFGGPLEFAVTRGGILDGLAGWFSATLAPGCELTNDPRSPRRIQRRSAVLPMAAPIAVVPGDRVRTAVRVMPDQTLVSWQVEIHFQDGRPRHRHAASTVAGMLLSREDLQSTRPDVRPRLTRAGSARRVVLTLADGAHTIAEIQRAVRADFADVAPDEATAAAFVAEVLVRYAR